MYNVSLNAPLTVNLSLSLKCNFLCEHCYSRTEDARDEMSYNDLCRTVDILSAWKVPFLNLGGGEPLMHPRLFDFVRYASEKGLHCSMNSNGFLLDRAAAREIKRAGFKSVGISIDSPVAGIHDEFRNKPGSFNRAVSALEHLSAEGVKSTVSMVVTTLNHLNFTDILPMLTEHAVKQLFLHNYKCSGMGYKNMERYDLTPLQWKDFYARALRFKQSVSDIIVSFDDPIIHLLADYTDRPLVKGSTCGKLSINIRSNGDITPCGFMPVPIGNILTDDIVTLWKESPVLTNLRTPVARGKCTQCSIYDTCLGGCKARTYMVTGDFHNPDPHCWKEGGEQQ